MLQEVQILILFSNISFNVFMNSSSSVIMWISIFRGNRLNKVFNAISFDEKVISDKYFALFRLQSIWIMFLSLSSNIDSPFIYIKCNMSVFESVEFTYTFRRLINSLYSFSIIYLFTH